VIVTAFVNVESVEFVAKSPEFPLFVSLFVESVSSSSGELEEHELIATAKRLISSRDKRNNLFLTIQHSFR
jgi:hypothetical protein